MHFFKEKQHRMNWARVVKFRPKNYFFPRDVDELVAIVKKANAKGESIRVIGSGHSFTPIADSKIIMISLTHLRGIISVDNTKNQATVWGGTKLNELSTLLNARGLALPNMGDIDQQSIAGALQTGTHGTGVNLTCLSGFITEQLLLFPNGELVVCGEEKNRELFRFSRVALGTLGIVVSLTIQCVKSYHLEDKRWSMPLHDGLSSSEQLAKTNRHYEFYWFPFTEKIAAKTLNIVPYKKPRNIVRAFVDDHIVENMVYQGVCSLAYRQTWITKHINNISTAFLSRQTSADASYRIFPAVRNVRFNEMEFSVPLENGAACLYAIKKFIEKQNLRIFLPIEYRYVAEDDIPLSPFYRRDSVSISLHVYRGLDQKPYFDGAQEIFTRFDGRPHWGKVHSLKSATLSKLYEKLPEYRHQRKVIDPKATFLSPYLRELLL